MRIGLDDVLYGIACIILVTVAGWWGAAIAGAYLLGEIVAYARADLRKSGF